MVGFTGRSTAMALLDAIRNHDQVQVSGTRVVIVSEDAKNREFAWQSGVDGYLTKPFHSDEFIAEVRAAIDRPEDQRQDHRLEQLRAPESDDE